jgi:hypothetical protein
MAEEVSIRGDSKAYQLILCAIARDIFNPRMYGCQAGEQIQVKVTDDAIRLLV